MKKLFPWIFFIIFGTTMIFVVLKLSPVGDPHLPGYSGAIPPHTPSHEIPIKGRSVALKYNRDAARDCTATDIVTSIIYDYRGYDTLMETTVLFTAVIAVLSIIGKGEH